jgi:hypothetical protein
MIKCKTIINKQSMRNPHSICTFKHYLAVIFLTGLSFTVQANMYQGADSVYTQKKIFSSEDIVRGKRLFYGLVYFENKSINCVRCHNLKLSDTINWNPNAIEISKKYFEKSAKDLSKVLLNPRGPKIEQVHKGFQLVPEDIVLIKSYMDTIAGGDLKNNKPDITNLLLFIIASVLILVSLTDLIIIKRVKRKWIHYIVITVTGTFITYQLVVSSIMLGRSQFYSPDQPVKFSHAVHAGQNKIDCIYCHCYAPYSKTAGIPSENVCMNCHLLVRNGTRTGAFEIAKVINAFNTGTPIEWVKVHNLPDHVFFSHAQHVTAGGISCQKCHGDVKSMNRIEQVSDLSMGWCINCHRTTKVNFQGNKFYSQYTMLAEKLRNGTIDSVTVSMIGGTECMKCHY